MRLSGANLRLKQGACNVSFVRISEGICIMEEECCPGFDPSAPWDGKLLEWENKRFVRDKVKTFFFIPLNFGSVITSFE